MNYLVKEVNADTGRATGRYLKAGAPNGSKWTRDHDAAIRYSELRDAQYAAGIWANYFASKGYDTRTSILPEQGDLAPAGTVDAWSDL